MCLCSLPTGDYAICVGSCDPTGAIVPDGFGANAEKDIASIKSSVKLATSVNCACTKCGDFDELKSWVAYDKGGCKVAAEHMGLSQYPS